MANTKLVSEIPFEPKDKSNPKEAINGALMMLEEGEILTLPLKKTKRIVTIDGKTSVLIESAIDFSKNMRISEIL